MIEFHTASCGTFNRRDFDELMHIHSNMATSRAASLGLSPLATLKCCLILPCEATEEEIFRVGKHLHSLLKLPGSLYYRTLDDPVATSSSATADSGSSTTERASLPHSRSVASSRSDLLNEDGKMTEDSFRRFARYRIKKEEPEAIETNDAHALGPDHFLAYQQQRKVAYSLHSLQTGGWDRRLTS
uniref:Uncharacterized protein n=1 Tax=Globisporangium ultimum (strain ATCC 200006 / CBS 805.95 / DAOM BR144) TaxID=431595 RepID=K3W567_GLOUD